MKHILFLRRALIVALISLLPMITQGFAQTRLEGGEKVVLEILRGSRTANGNHIAALKLSLTPEWVTYWRVPGEAGIPPQFSLSNSENISSVSFKWPRPKVEVKNGLRSFVYYDQVIVPIVLKLKDPQKPARLTGSLKIGVCEDVCIPVRLNFDALLPVKISDITSTIDHALTLGPRHSTTAATCVFTPNATEMGLQISAKIPRLSGQEHVVVEHSDQALWLRPARVERKGNTLNIQTSIASENGIPSGLQRRDLRITVLGSDDMIEFNGCQSPH